VEALRSFHALRKVSAQPTLYNRHTCLEWVQICQQLNVYRQLLTRLRIQDALVAGISQLNRREFGFGLGRESSPGETEAAFAEGFLMWQRLN
jgi:hypothetical protein